MNLATQKPTPSELFLDALTDELIAMPDDQVLDGIDTTSVQSRGMSRITKAKSEAGRIRLATAKLRVNVARGNSSIGLLPQVSIETARKYLESAANDTRYTLAARNLNEMSDDDVIRLYSQIKRLESRNTGHGDSNK